MTDKEGLLLTPEENPYRKPLRAGVTWNEEVIKAFEDGAKAQLAKFLSKLDSPEVRERALHICIESLRAAEMRQGCTNHSYYAEILLRQIVATIKEVG